MEFQTYSGTKITEPLEAAENILEAEGADQMGNSW